jgi:hypothetical protein
MKNITEIFKKAMLGKVNWVFSIFYLSMAKLETEGIELSFWEEEENWASILLNNKTVGYIWKKYPIVILERKISSKVQEQLIDINIIYYIEVDYLNKDLFRIEDDELKAYFGDFDNFNSFTMEDLWFQTNSL